MVESMMENLMTWQWLALAISLGGLWFIVPKATSVNDFFHGSRKDVQPNASILTASLVISWLFAKSITNAADLGKAFGIVGGVAYAAYYLSFFVAGVVIYFLRTRGGFWSIHAFLRQKFGHAAVIVFTVLIGFRLLNEVWSNTMVVGSYFGEAGSVGYYAAIVLFTTLTLAYTLKGGMQSSLLTDLIQFLLFVCLLFFILTQVIPATDGGVATIVSTGQWKWEDGLNLLLVGVIQSMSYPFHDPVMTDRGFITQPKTALKSFIWAGIIGGICIILFSFVGVFARLKGLDSTPTIAVARFFGTSMALALNVIMVTSAASTIDSAFSSATKLIHFDMGSGNTLSIQRGRLSMILFAVLGTIPILFNPEILSATTISGTMVLGLAPVFLFWFLPAKAASFHAAVGVGILIGIIYVFWEIPESLWLTPGKYGDLLTVNVVGTILCFTAYLLPLFFGHKHEK